MHMDMCTTTVSLVVLPYAKVTETHRTHRTHMDEGMNMQDIKICIDPMRVYAKCTKARTCEEVDIRCRLELGGREVALSAVHLCLYVCMRMRVA